MKFLLAVVIAIVALVYPTLAQKSLLNVCSLPHSRNGNGKAACMAYMPSWSYNSNTKSCVKFIYGGCGGNANRFGSQAACEAKCMRK